MGEARLAEMMEGLCSQSDAKCNSLMEDIEEPLEEWWAAKVTYLRARIMICCNVVDDCVRGCVSVVDMM